MLMPSLMLHHGKHVALFALGRVLATPGALEALSAAGQRPEEFLARHVRGDWGELGQADKQENELSVRKGFRILSAYTLSTGVRIWIITEADRSATTILLPNDISASQGECTPASLFLGHGPVLASPPVTLSNWQT